MSSIFNWKDDKSPSVVLRATRKKPAGHVYKPTRQPFRPVIEPRKETPAPPADE